MKVVSSWPNYAIHMIVAVTEDGEVWGLPMPDGGLPVGRWRRLANWIVRESCDLSAHDSSLKCNERRELPPTDLPRVVE